MSDPNDPPADARSVFAPGDPIPGLSSWVLVRRLGGGGFGEVWLACHAWNELEKPRAVKFCTEPTFRHRLVTHEKNVVLRVMKYAGDHPNIVPLVECNLDGQLPWLMYEYVEGGTLAELAGQWRELALPKRLGRAVRTLYAVAAALAACHRLAPPLVHRDLKPANVLMAGNVPRITDFGIGSVAMAKDDDSSGGPTALGARLPTAMRVSGTRLYAPPEQLLGAPPHPRDDVYALGVIAFQLITGDLATGPGADAADELRDLKVPAELASLVVRSVAMNADRRPADAAEWEEVLGRLIKRAHPSGRAGDSSIAALSVLLAELPPEPTPNPSSIPLPRSGPRSASVPVPTPAFDEPWIPPRDPEPRSRAWTVVGAVLVLVLVAAMLVARCR